MASVDPEKAAKSDAIAPTAREPSICEGDGQGKNDAVADIVHAAESEYTAAQYRSVLRKADLILLPLMWIVSGAQYADKVSVSTQATFGLRTDTHLVGQQYSCELLSAESCIIGGMGRAPWGAVSAHVPHVAGNPRPSQMRT